MKHLSRRKWLGASLGTVGIWAGGTWLNAVQAKTMSCLDDVQTVREDVSQRLDTSDNVSHKANDLEVGKVADSVWSRFSLQRYPAEPIEGPILILRDGSRITASVSLPTLDFSSSQPFDAAGWSHETAGIPPQMVAGVLCRLPTDPWQRDRLYDAILNEARCSFEDILRLTNGDWLKGFRLTYHAASDAVDTSTRNDISAASGMNASTIDVAGANVSTETNSAISAVLPIGFTGAFWSIELPAYEPPTESTATSGSAELAGLAESIETTESTKSTGLKSAESIESNPIEILGSEKSADASAEKFRIWNIPATWVAAAVWGRRFIPFPSTIARSTMTAPIATESTFFADSAANNSVANSITNAAVERRAFESGLPVDWLGLRDGTLVASTQFGPLAGGDRYRAAWLTGGEVQAASEEISFALPTQPDRIYLSDGRPEYTLQAGRSEATGWGRDRGLDGGMLRERGRLVLRGVAQAVHSQLSFDLTQLVALTHRRVVTGVTGRFAARLAVGEGEADHAVVSAVAGMAESAWTSWNSETSPWSAVLDEVGGEVRGKIFVDGQKVWESPPMRRTTALIAVEIPLHQVTRMDLVVETPERWMTFGLQGMNWLDAAIFLENPPNS